jgi:hypothetical protein
MPFIDEFCLFHGYTLVYDRKSGHDVCPECELEKEEYMKQESDKISGS